MHDFFGIIGNSLDQDIGFVNKDGPLDINDYDDLINSGDFRERTKLHENKVDDDYRKIEDP